MYIYIYIFPIYIFPIYIPIYSYICNFMNIVYTFYAYSLLIFYVYGTSWDTLGPGPEPCPGRTAQGGWWTAGERRAAPIQTHALFINRLQDKLRMLKIWEI